MYAGSSDKQCGTISQHSKQQHLLPICSWLLVRAAEHPKPLNAAWGTIKKFATAELHAEGRAFCLQLCEQNFAGIRSVCTVQPCSAGTASYAGIIFYPSVNCICESLDWRICKLIRKERGKGKRASLRTSAQSQQEGLQELPFFLCY